LIENEANVNAVNNKGLTTLMCAAAFNSNPEISHILLENGANVNAVTNAGITPLMLAAGFNPNPEVIQILIENGADVSIEDIDGENALNYAEENEKLKGSDAYSLLEKMTFLNNH
jgi:ankyrin repeat protein